MSDKTEKTRAPLLIDEMTILVYPSLAVALGINKAIVFQQLHFLLNGQKEAKNKYNHVDGRWWVYNSYPEWRSTYFPWLSISSLKGIFLSLEKDGLVIAKQSVKNKSDRRKWYTIDYAVWDKKCLTIGQNLSHQPSDKKCPMDGTKTSRSKRQKLADGYSETSSETSSESGSAPTQDAPILLPEMLPSTHTPLREKPVTTQPIPLTPNAAAPLPASWQNLEARNSQTGYHPLIEAWRAAYPVDAPPTPNASDTQTAIAAANDGYTPEQVTALTKEKLTAGKTMVKFGWVVQDLSDYVLRQSKLKPKPTIQFPAYVTPPQPAPVSRAEIEAIKARVYAAAEKESAS